MDITQFQTLVQNNPPDVWASKLEIYGLRCRIKDCLTTMKQYYIEFHDVNSTSKRQDKPISDERTVTNINGIESTEIVTTGLVKVARLSLSLQKKIVLTAAGFLGKPTMEASTEDDTEERLLSLIQKTWDDNKLDWKFMNIAKKTMSEYECAELWYTQEAEPGYWDGYTTSSKYKLGMKVLARSLGDEMYPVFDDYGAMIAFFRKYKTINGEGKEDLHVDLYTAEALYFAKQEGGKWLHANAAGEYASETRITIPNIMKKIPVIYYHQPTLEWQDVQSLIDRLETKISNHADTNDYFDSPIMLASGEIEGLANKDERGKMFQLKGAGADMKYLTWDQAPESTKMEIENLVKFIHELTYTPDISFEAMKGLGAFSKVALDMFFIGARLKAADKQEIFGEAVQRRINYLKHALMIMDPSLKPASKLSIKLKFNSFLPTDNQEVISTLNSAVKGGLMSQETAIMQNPLLKDPTSEIEKIKTEQEEADKKAAEIAKQNPPIPFK
jgi:SPP1 family phage portal protein